MKTSRLVVKEASLASPRAGQGSLRIVAKPDGTVRLVAEHEGDEVEYELSPEEAEKHGATLIKAAAVAHLYARGIAKVDPRVG